MIIVEPKVELIWITPDAEQLIEMAGRTCYKSERSITQDSAAKFIQKLIGNHHLSVIEHASASFRFICDRGVTHEMVRHRLASYSQESTRYCNYGKSKFQGQIRVIEPPGLDKKSKETWEQACLYAEKAYLELIKLGNKPQIARSVLPNCLKTEIVMTCNLREWCHVFSLRLPKSAHPQIRQSMGGAWRILNNHCPALFEKFTDHALACPPIS